MTAKELFEKHGSVWWAFADDSSEKCFKPLGLSEDGSLIIGESCSRQSYYRGSYFSSDDTNFILYQEPKKKVTKWLWSYRSNSEEDCLCTIFLKNEEEAKFYGLKKIKKLEWSATEFEE